MEGRRERKKRQTREAIATTALRLFAERGYDAVTVADVAAAADVAVTTVFNYFKTKEELFFGAFTPPSDLLADRLRARAPGVGPVEVLRSLLDEALDHLTDWAGEEHHTRIRTTLATSESLRALAMHRFRARRFESLAAVSAALAAPEAPDVFATLVAAQLLALVDGVMTEAEGRRRAGEVPAAIASAVRPALERACVVLAAGLEDYGKQPLAPLRSKGETPHA